MLGCTLALLVGYLLVLSITFPLWERPVRFWTLGLRLKPPSSGLLRRKLTGVSRFAPVGTVSSVRPIKTRTARRLLPPGGSVMLLVLSPPVWRPP